MRHVPSFNLITSQKRRKWMRLCIAILVLFLEILRRSNSGSVFSFTSGCSLSLICFRFLLLCLYVTLQKNWWRRRGNLWNWEHAFMSWQIHCLLWLVEWVIARLRSSVRYGRPAGASMLRCRFHFSKSLKMYLV